MSQKRRRGGRRLCRKTEAPAPATHGARSPVLAVFPRSAPPMRATQDPPRSSLRSSRTCPLTAGIRMSTMVTWHDAYPSRRRHTELHPREDRTPPLPDRSDAALAVARARDPLRTRGARQGTGRAVGQRGAEGVRCRRARAVLQVPHVPGRVVLLRAASIDAARPISTHHRTDDGQRGPLYQRRALPRTRASRSATGRRARSFRHARALRADCTLVDRPAQSLHVSLHTPDSTPGSPR